MRTTLSSSMPGSSQTMATTKSPGDLNDPIFEDEDDDDGKDENGQV